MTFSTETFILEALKPKDASSLSALMISNGKKFQKYLPHTLQQNLSEADSKAYISRKKKAFKNKLEFTFGIKENEIHVVVGLIILKNIDYHLKIGELSYCIGQEYSGKGWVTQSVKAASQFAHEELDLKTLQITIHKSNTKSINVALRCGFTWTKTLVNECISNEEVLNMELYERYY